MKVERLDIYDFKVVFSQADFVIIKDVAEEKNIEIEDAIDLIVEAGIEHFINY